jgi:hypothetical protein
MDDHGGQINQLQSRIGTFTFAQSEVWVTNQAISVGLIDFFAKRVGLEALIGG